MLQWTPQKAFKTFQRLTEWNYIQRSCFMSAFKEVYKSVSARTVMTKPQRKTAECVDAAEPIKQIWRREESSKSALMSFLRLTEDAVNVSSSSEGHQLFRCWNTRRKAPPLSETSPPLPPGGSVGSSQACSSSRRRCSRRLLGESQSPAVYAKVPELSN